MIRSSRESATERMSLTPVGAECDANNSTMSCSYQGVRLEAAWRDDRVGHHECAFLGVQSAALPQNGVGEVDFAEVLEQRSVAHASPAGRVEPEVLRQPLRQRRVLVSATS